MLGDHLCMLNLKVDIALFATTANPLHYTILPEQNSWPLTLKVPVTAIDALRHFETG